MALAVGATFSDYAELEQEIEKYQTENSVQLYKRDSRTIEAGSK